jgi:hypothetical protein
MTTPDTASGAGFGGAKPIKGVDCLPADVALSTHQRVIQRRVSKVQGAPMKVCGVTTCMNGPLCVRREGEKTVRAVPQAYNAQLWL